MGGGGSNNPVKKILTASAVSNPVGASIGLVKKGVDTFKDVKKAQKDAINAAQAGADASRDQLDLQRKSIEDAKKAKDKALRTKEQEDAAFAAGESRDSARRRQRTRSKGARGRRSTILTTGEEQASPTAKRTLLGQ